MAKGIAAVVITLTVDADGDFHTSVEFESDDADLRHRVRALLNALAQLKMKESLDG